MVTHRLVMTAITLASLGTACTAIVLGKIGDTGDYKTVPTGGSSSSGTPLDECSLLKGNSAGDRDANACATCIQTSCTSDVAYACNNTPASSGGSSRTSPKPWFDDLKTCAKEPWNGFPPPQSSSSGSFSSWGCKKFETTEPTVSDKGSDTEREPLAHNCVTNNCLQGDTPPCKMCEVHIQKSAADPTEALLRDDDCGKCLVANCQPTLVKCCATPAMHDFVARCAFTKVETNKAACGELGKAMPDGGPGFLRNYEDAGVQCLNELSACYTAKCAGKGTCP